MDSRRSHYMETTLKTVGKKRYSIRTWTGQFIEGVDGAIDPRQIELQDIAHGLSNLCRFSGQARFYTVAGHSILVSEWIEQNGGTPQEALWGLLHDASEAYITDMPMPVKIFCPQYYAIEKNFMKAICIRFGLPEKQPAIVYRADHALLAKEMSLEGIFCGSFPYVDKHPYQDFVRRFFELGGFQLDNGVFDVLGLRTHEGNDKRRPKDGGSKVRHREAPRRAIAKRRPARSRNNSNLRGKKV
jgi:hypothetical protein